MARLTQAHIVVPDSSHWAKWIDATGAEGRRGEEARSFYERLLERGRVPMLTWHHVEELLGHENERRARRRCAFLSELPLLAWLRSPGSDVGIGSVVQVLAAEVVAVAEGHRALTDVRDRARELVVSTGGGDQAMGDGGWTWLALRPHLRARRPHADLVAAVTPMEIFDESRTIGELARLNVNPPAEVERQLGVIRLRILGQMTRAAGGDHVRGQRMTDEFMDRLRRDMPPRHKSVRELLVSTLVRRGLDESEIQDHCVLADLMQLVAFRQRLRAVAPEMGHAFGDLKQIPMASIPSEVIGGALRKHGQLRDRRPGSDVNDLSLAVLAAYSDTLCVDKRTAEDFRRARRKEPWLTDLIGRIVKTANFLDLLGDHA